MRAFVERVYIAQATRRNYSILGIFNGRLKKLDIMHRANVKLAKSSQREMSNLKCGEVAEVKLLLSYFVRT